MLDFNAYLHRLGLGTTDASDWQAIHRAHATTIPFENLDSHQGIPISLHPADIEEKMVVRRRGGYCFEHNLLLGSALEHLGMKVEPMLARVRAGVAASQTRPVGHLLLKVTDGRGLQWHADVGFGLGTLLDPIPFGPTGVHEQSGWKFQVVPEDEQLVLQTLGTEGWSDTYAFRPIPVPQIDIDVSNWWICTNPASPFVSGLIASMNYADGRREAICDWSGTLTVMAIRPDGIEVTETSRELIPSLLAERFGLAGFELDRNGKVYNRQHLL